MLLRTSKLPGNLTSSRCFVFGAAGRSSSSSSNKTEKMAEEAGKKDVADMIAEPGGVRTSNFRFLFGRRNTFSFNNDP